MVLANILGCIRDVVISIGEHFETLCFLYIVRLDRCSLLISTLYYGQCLWDFNCGTDANVST